ncbi:MAG: hypothetical protein IPM81_18825 [Saprospirales bacterium]|nr:hypothetical protein [Saprospirales bacterium]
MKLIYIALFFALVCSLPGLPAQTYYSQGTGNWETLSNWNTDPGGAGTAPGSIPDDPAINIVVQSGHTVTINSVGNYDVHNLTVDGTLLSSTSSSTNRYINVYGTDLNVDGTLGGPDNGMSIDVNGPSCLFSGNGTVQLSRLRKDHDDAGVSLVTNLTIDIDITLSWASTAAFYYNGIGTTAKSFNVTINTGKTVTVTSSDVSIDGIDGTNSSWADGTFTINGTLDVGRDLYATTAPPRRQHFVLPPPPPPLLGRARPPPGPGRPPPRRPRLFRTAACFRSPEVYPRWFLPACRYH